MEDLHFLRPLWFLAVAPLAMLLLTLARRAKDGGAWRKVCDPQLIPYVLEQSRVAGSRRGLLLLGLGGLLGITALAGPVWQQIATPVFAQRNALVIALDLSLSMDATDISPSRLRRALFEIQDILKSRDAGRGETALLAYAGEAFTVTPLTDDTDTISNLLEALGSDLMPSPGSRASLALERAAELLRQAANADGDILLVTDGVDTAALDTVKRLREQGIRTSILAMGTAGGAPIPTGNGFLQDGQGSIVVPAVDFPLLGRLAAAGDGVMVRGEAGDGDLDSIYHWLEQRADPLAGDEDELRADLWEEEGPWLVLLLLPLAAFAFRRGVLAGVLIAAVLGTPPAKAEPPSPAGTLWKTPDQVASELLEQGDARAAANSFRDPSWRAVAQYRSGAYEEAANSLEGLEDTTSLYNRGNALARLGRLQDALLAYERVLQQDPGNEDARFNRDLIQQLQSANNPGSQDQQDPGQGNESQAAGQDQPQAGEDGQQAMADQQQGDASTQQQDQQSQAQQGDDGEPGDQPSPADQAMADMEQAESAQATEQWLRRIPDDPGGLLRRKFYYQYQQRPRATPKDNEESW